jgi:hypothetical protein
MILPRGALLPAAGRRNVRSPMTQIARKQRHRLRPRVTVARATAAMMALEGTLWFSEQFKWSSLNAHKGWAVLIATAGAIALFLLMLLFAVTFWIIRRRFQFTLGALLAVPALFAIPCAWLCREMDQARKQHRAVEEIRRAGGAVYYDYDWLNPAGGAVPEAGPPGPSWLRGLLGEDMLANASGVKFWFRPEYESADVLRHIAELRGLKYLGLFNKGRGAWLQHLEGMTQIAMLELSDTGIDDAGLEHLGGLTQLEVLDLGGTEISGAGLQHLKGLPRLECVLLTYSNVSDAGLACLTGMSALECVDLRGTEISDAGMKHLKGLSRLRTLRLGSTRVGDAGLEHLKGLTQLRELDLWQTKVGDAGMEHLKGLTQLQEIELARTRVGDAGLDHLKGLTQLQRLHLSETKVGDAGLEHLKELTQLQAIDLSKTKVGDAGLEHLKGLSCLEYLDLDDTNVSVGGLKYLKELTKLEWLGLAGTRVSGAGVSDLKKALPNCDIVR